MRVKVGVRVRVRVRVCTITGWNRDETLQNGMYGRPCELLLHVPNSLFIALT
jgi:hypothetical protein